MKGSHNNCFSIVRNQLSPGGQSLPLIAENANSSTGETSTNSGRPATPSAATFFPNQRVAGNPLRANTSNPSQTPLSTRVDSSPPNHEPVGYPAEMNALNPGPAELPIGFHP